MKTGEGFFIEHKIMKSHSKVSSRKGFTLVEILIVVAIMGVLAAIGIVAITGIYSVAETSKNRRNAQSAAILYASARAAGATFSSPPADKVGVVQELIDGKAGTGTLSSLRFQLPGVSSIEAASLADFLEFNENVGLLYLAGSGN